MPHIVVEVGGVRELGGWWDSLLVELENELVAAAAGSPKPVDRTSIKSRVIGVGPFRVGEPQASGFLHTTISLLAGRSDDVRRAIADSAFAALQREVARREEIAKFAISLEVREMEPSTYRK